MEELKKLILEVIETIPPSGFIQGLTFEQVLENTYRMAIARGLLQLIDEGKVDQVMGFYRKGN